MRMYLKNKKSIRIKRIIVVLLILLCFNLVITTILNNVGVYFLEYATLEVKQLSATVINSSVTNEVLAELNDDLFVVTKNSQAEIEMIDYNSLMVNKFLRGITSNLSNNLIDLENGKLDILKKKDNPSDIIFYIPFGRIFNMSMFNNMGPLIPVRVDYVGYVLTNIKTVIKEYGINNSLIEMSVHIEISAKVMLPVMSSDIIITNDIPLSYKIIKGMIPNYYSNNGISKNSNIFSIPIE